MPSPAGLTIRLKKNADGRTSLSCTRADGTTTWQRQEGGHAAFFPRHDLTHYAVETCLGHRQGFYGLVADGWDLTDFGQVCPRGPMPHAAGLTEMIVGLFDQERATGHLLIAADLNALIADNCATRCVDALSYNEEDISRVRKSRAELFSRWDSLPPGETLELQFPTDSHRRGSPDRKIRRQSEAR